MRRLEHAKAHYHTLDYTRTEHTGIYQNILEKTRICLKTLQRICLKTLQQNYTMLLKHTSRHWSTLHVRRSWVLMLLTQNPETQFLRCAVVDVGLGLIFSYGTLLRCSADCGHKHTGLALARFVAEAQTHICATQLPLLCQLLPPLLYYAVESELRRLEASSSKPTLTTPCYRSRCAGYYDSCCRLWALALKTRP